MAELKLPFIGHGSDYNPDQWRDRPDILAEDIRLRMVTTGTVLFGTLYSMYCAVSNENGTDCSAD